VYKQIYLESSKRYYTTTQKAKEEYYNTKVSFFNQKQLFQLVDGLLEIKHAPILPKHDSAFELAQQLNLYFPNKIQALRTELDNQLTRDLLVSVNEQISETPMSSFEVVSNDVVLRTINSALLKTSFGALLPSITSMVNQSLQSGIFPPQLKHALVTPLIKKPDADREVLKNYRPISNLPFVGKVMERIVSMQLNHHLLLNDLHSTFQSAHRHHHSTETAMLRITNRHQLGT